MNHLILIHGALGASDQLIPLGEKLEAHFDIHYLELDGHGESASFTRPFTMDHFIDQLNQLSNSLEGEIHVFGYSMGGFVALLSSSQGNSKIKSIFTLGTKLEWDPEIAKKEIRMLDPEIIEEKVPAFAKALEKRHGNNWKLVLKKTAELMSELGETQPINQQSMSRVNCPVHLCLADNDEMVNQEETQMIQGMISDCQFSILSDSKHPIEKVNLDELALEIIDFIK